MNDLFKDIKEETLEEGIKVFGSRGIYTPGLHEIVDTNIYIYEVTFGDNTWATAEVVVEDASGATLVNQMKATKTGNQTQEEVLRFMYGVAAATGLKTELVNFLKTQFNKLPLVSYKDKFNKDVKARQIKLFNNKKYYAVTSTEVSGDANGIFTNQILSLFNMFRHSDRASTSEIKEGNKDKFGNAFTYWEDPSISLDKTRIAWSKDDRHDNAVTREVVAYIMAGGVLDKKTKEKFQDGYTSAEVFGKAPTPTEADAVIEDTDDTDEIPF